MSKIIEMMNLLQNANSTGFSNSSSSANPSNASSTFNTSSSPSTLDSSSPLSSSSFTSTSDNSSSSNSNPSSTTANFEMPDMETIMKMSQIMKALNSKENNAGTNLLYSLKPFLRESKQEKLNQYANILKISSVISELNKNNQGGKME